jgi:hypothetical protein
MTTHEMPEPLPMRYQEVLAYVRSYANAHGENIPYDTNGVIHLMLAAFDNLREHWIDGDIDQLGDAMTAEQRQDFVRIGRLLEGYIS